MANRQALREVATVFFRLGCIAFGGPAAHIALLEEEVVRKRAWMSHAHFLDLIGVTNLIPGPNSTEMTMHCGHERAGWPGLIVAGICFIFPATVITGVFAGLYAQYGQLPQLAPFIYGIKPAVLAIILAAAITLGKKALKTIELSLLAVATVVACLLGVSEIVALFAGGLLGVGLYLARKAVNTTPVVLPVILLQKLIPAMPGEWIPIFWTFLKIGSLLYGGGYVLFAFLDAELVSQGLLTKQQLLDAVAVGQFTPGPVLSTATFIGWQMGGVAGALAATVGIFLPSFLFVVRLNPLIPRMRKSAGLAAFLDAVNAASVAVIVAVCLQMGKDTLTDWRTGLIAVASVAVTLIWKGVNGGLIILGGALAGYGLSLI